MTPVQLAPALQPLAAYPQFVGWRIEQRDGEETKVLYSPHHGGRASHSNPADWGTYEQARAFVDGNPSMKNIGFVFSDKDPFFFLDIDKAWNGQSWSMVAQELCARLPGVAIEVSQSGTGLHLIGRGMPPANHKNKNPALKIELYTKTRFCALTGTNATGSADTVVPPDVFAGVCEQFFKRDIDANKSNDWTTTPDPEWSGPEDDGELIARAMRSASQSAANAFGDNGVNPTFSDLFTANVETIGARWPDPQQGRGFDYTNAEQSLANMLAFWTGRNCERIERIMRMSALARSKWDTHATYLENTILRAVGLVRNVYKQTVARETAPVPPPPPLEAEELQDTGFTPRVGASPIMLAGAQIQHFQGCVYVLSLNKCLTPRGDLLDQARFNVEYGGHEFVVSLDGKRTTPSAWIAFTENHAYQPPKADRLCFRPEHGAGGIVIDSGKRLANAYIPAETEETDGDPSKFLDHMRKMLPHGEDLEQLLTYMASIKQNPGMKAQWWPVVQGAEGNFKSFLLTLMSYAVGSHYAHTPNMDKMIRGASNFNGWIERKLFLGLDEVFAANRREFFESFKTTVTNRSIPIEGKGIEEITGDNRANGMIVTNHQDGVPVMGKNRRYAAFFCAQQTPEDMERDGMTAAYIADLKDWMLGINAYAPLGVNYGLRVMNHYLAHKPLRADLDPNQLAVRPPVTTSTGAAVLAGRGRIEQEILEAIEEDRPGFAGGWVSSIFLDRLLDARKLSLAYSKRRDVMISLGYDYHPELGPTGRVYNPTPPDNGKPRLFCRIDGIHWLNLKGAGAVAKAYAEAQSRTASERSPAGQAFNK